MLNEDEVLEAPAEDHMTLRLKQVYLVVLIACAIVEAGIMADVASGGQLRRDLEWQWQKVKDAWQRQQEFRASAGWVVFQAQEIVRAGQ